MLSVIGVLFLFLALQISAFADVSMATGHFSPDGSLAVDFVSFRSDEGLHGTEFTIKNRAGDVVYADKLAEAVEGARWTADSKYLIAAVPARANGHAKNPWRYYFYIISIADHKFQWFAGSDESPFISAEVWCQEPDMIILVANTMDNGSDTPDDPVLRRYKVGELWKTLK